MKELKKKFQVRPNTVGYLFRDNVFEKMLLPGVYDYWDWKDRLQLFVLPVTSRLITVTNQEVLTSDNIALRFSFNLIYKIVNGNQFLENFALDRPIYSIINDAELRLSNIAQVYLRKKISGYDSESLNEKRGELADFKSEEMEGEASAFGITIEQAQIRDLTFPKSIQNLFAKHLEAKIRAKSELENARTVVATARALKNASDLIKEDENIKFFQILETFTKIAEKGRHTFMIGDFDQFTKK